MPRLFTVGHGTRSTEELIAVLRSADVGRLVDVRRYPRSRRHPHFSKDALEDTLPEAGISYAWRGEELGGRRAPTQRGSRSRAWRVPGFQAYADYMASPEFQRALVELEAEVEKPPPLAIMCAERLWWRCHRRLIADAAMLRGLEVVHLLDAEHHQPHRLHEAVRLDAEGRPVYDVGLQNELPL